MRKIVILIIATIVCTAIFISCGTEGKTTIFSGRVTEADTSVYLVGVKVYEKSHANLSTTTDHKGYFKMDGVSAEEHNIYFEKEGFKTFVFNFEYTGSLEHPLISQHIILEKDPDCD
ncbi:MAG: carboxypeptidase regulatory-like domain-containing protein [FCB group bacterium]|nr:carboxypeptidase regulatory-like domain-containing protein [FCB group bacterium]